MSEYNKIAEGYFTVGAAGASQFISLPYVPNTFEIWNKTQWGAAPSGATPVATAEYAIGFAEDAAGTYYAEGAAASSSSAALLATTGTSGGFSFINAGTYMYGPSVTITSITASTGVVLTSAAHGLSVGDAVLLTGTTGMLQIAGTTTTVTAVSDSTHFTIGNIPTSGFSNASAGTVKKLLFPDLYVPYGNIITGITSGATTTISTSLNHSFVVGQEVFFTIPQTGYTNTTPVWGTTQLDTQFYNTVNVIPQQAYIVSITNANTFVVNVNSTGFGAFTYPTSAQAAMGVTFPQVLAIGDQNTGYVLGSPLPLQPTGQTYTNTTYPKAITIPGAFLANTRQGVLIGGTLLPNASDVIRWRAVYPDLIKTSA